MGYKTLMFFKWILYGILDIAFYVLPKLWRVIKDVITWTLVTIIACFAVGSVAIAFCEVVRLAINVLFHTNKVFQDGLFIGFYDWRYFIWGFTLAMIFAVWGIDMFKWLKAKYQRADRKSVV